MSSQNKAIIKASFLMNCHVQNTINCEHNRYKMMSIIGLVLGIRA